MAHLDGDEHDLVEREEHRDLDHDGQTAGGGIGAFALVQPHHLLIEPLLVVLEALAQHQHLRLQLAHLGHGDVGLVGEREEQQLDAHGQDQDRHAEVAEALVDVVQGIEQRLGQEIEPAEIDRAVEESDAVVVAVVVEHGDDLGAGEQPAPAFGRDPGQDHDPFVEVVGLVFVVAAAGAVHEARLDRLVLIGH